MVRIRTYNAFGEAKWTCVFQLLAAPVSMVVVDFDAKILDRTQVNLELFSHHCSALH